MGQARKIIPTDEVRVRLMSRDTGTFEEDPEEGLLVLKSDEDPDVDEEKGISSVARSGGNTKKDSSEGIIPDEDDEIHELLF